MSLNYRLETYAIRAIRQMRLGQIARGQWEARADLFDLSAVGFTPEEAEGRLFVRIEAFVQDALAKGWRLPVLDNVDPNPELEVEPTPVQLDAIDALADYAIRETKAGRTKSLNEVAADLGVSLDVV